MSKGKGRGGVRLSRLTLMGDTAAAFVALPQIPPRNRTWYSKGKWVHFAKIAFEKYFLYKIRHGSTSPVYKKYLLKALGIVHLVEAKAKKHDEQ